MRSLLIVLVLFLTGCARPQEIPVYSAIPDFNLTERSNRTVTRKEFEGKIWIADFIFTHCGGICPAMSANMQKLQDRLPKDVMLVSFSVDPANDTPAVLSEYAKRYNADPDRWLFLTGDIGAIQELSVKGFKLAMDPTGGTEVEPIAHSSRFVLVDRKGRIRGYYGMEEADTLDRIVADVKRLS